MSEIHVAIKKSEAPFCIVASENDIEMYFAGQAELIGTILILGDALTKNCPLDNPEKETAPPTKKRIRRRIRKSVCRQKRNR